MKAACYIAIAIATLTVAAADAQRIPTDVELKAAYCVKVTQALIANLGTPSATDPAIQKLHNETLRDSNDRMNRLQAYLLPRMQTLDTVSMIAAMKRGEADGANHIKTWTDTADKCAQQCGLLTGPTGEAKEKARQCFAACMESDQLVS